MKFCSPSKIHVSLDRKHREAHLIQLMITSLVSSHFAFHRIIGFFSGWLYDISGSYNNTYYASGSGITLAGLLVLITTICERGKARDKTYQAECSSPLTEEVNI